MMTERKHVAIIGGGVFGVLCALQLVDRGFQVTLFEKNQDILLGASNINQNRIHLGYHYPRSEETSIAAYAHEVQFRELFEEAVVADFDHYYCIAKEGSKVSAQQYLDFCDRVHLPYQHGLPSGLTLLPGMIDLSVKVPEKFYDADRLQAILKRLIAERRGRLTVMCGTEVFAVNQDLDGFGVYYNAGEGRQMGETYHALVNASYSNLNSIIDQIGFKMQEYQYELCEVVVVKVPWQEKVACTIMDGPFFGIVPFGFSGKYLLYDVELSVLERSIGILPVFEHDSTYYDNHNRRKERFKQYVRKSRMYIQEMEHCEFIRSVYITRIVLSNHDHDDARPSEIIDHGGGFLSVFSGKVSLALPLSKQIADRLVAYFGYGKG
jgi:hypothetical protein